MKNKVIILKCDEHFKQETEKAAAEKGMSVSMYVRYLIQNDKGGARGDKNKNQ